MQLFALFMFVTHLSPVAKADDTRATIVATLVHDHKALPLAWYCRRSTDKNVSVHSPVSISREGNKNFCAASISVSISENAKFTDDTPKIKLPVSTLDERRKASMGEVTFKVYPDIGEISLLTPVIQGRRWLATVPTSDLKPGTVNDLGNIEARPIPRLKVITTIATEEPTNILLHSDHEMPSARPLRNGQTPLAGTWIVPPGTYTVNEDVEIPEGSIIVLRRNDGPVTRIKPGDELEITMEDQDITLSIGPAVINDSKGYW